MRSRVSLRDQTQRLVSGKGEIIFFADRHRHRPRAGELDHRAVNRKAGIGIKNVGARFAEHQDRHEHGRLAAGEDHHLVRRNLDLETLVQIGGDRLAQRQDADRRRVAVMAVAQRLDRRLDDEIRRAEIGLADAEIDDVAAGRGKLRGAGEHRKRVLLADAIEGGNGLQHAGSSAQLPSKGKLRAVMLHCNKSSEDGRRGVDTTGFAPALNRPI